MQLNKQDIHQTVYIPIKNKELFGRNIISGTDIDYHYDLILKKYDRLLYLNKIKKQKRNIESKVASIESFNLIHAHTLFSDGGTAYLLKKTFGIHYVVNVRNTDINMFYKYGLHLRRFIHEVLINASAIVFISHAYKQKTFNFLPLNVKEIIENKSYVIPNGIDDSWFVGRKPNSKDKVDMELTILFVGSLDQNKNLLTVLRLLKKISNDGKYAFLNVVGDGPLKEKYKNYIKHNKIENRVKFYGHVSKEELRSIADQSTLFILPSYKETFGISYIEAMSRGLPIIYTKNEGVDGYFKEGSVGYSTKPNDVQEILNKINLIKENYEEISQECISKSKQFNWRDITKTYVDLYKDIKG